MVFYNKIMRAYVLIELKTKQKRHLSILMLSLASFGIAIQNLL